MTDKSSEIRATLKAPWFLRLLRPRIYPSKDILIRATSIEPDTSDPVPIQRLRVQTQDFLFTSAIRIEDAERRDTLLYGSFQRSHVQAFQAAFKAIQSALKNRKGVYKQSWLRTFAELGSTKILYWPSALYLSYYSVKIWAKWFR